MKRIFAAALAAMLLTAPLPSYAETPISVTLDGEQIDFDVPPKAINNRVLVPMRKIYERLGAKVTWIGEMQLILAQKDDKMIAMELGKTTVEITNLINGETKTVTLDVPSVAENGRTLVPVRAVSEALDMEVSWDSETQTVVIMSKGE